MKCPKCKREIEDHSMFCEFCGHKITKAKWPWFVAAAVIVVGAIVGVVISNGNDKKAKSVDEERFFQNCTSSADYRDYLLMYPNGQYAMLAQNKLEQLKSDSIQLAQEAFETELMAYENCKTAQQCRRYLRNYPTGQYVGRVREMLNQFVSDSIDKAQAEARQIESEMQQQSSSSSYSNTSSNRVSGTRYVVIDGSELRLRLGPSTSADTFKWGDGSNRHPVVGEKFRYLGESGDFYEIDFKGHQLWVSKLYTHIENH